jgi:hypothetical protein
VAIPKPLTPNPAIYGNHLRVERRHSLGANRSARLAIDQAVAKLEGALTHGQ